MNYKKKKIFKAKVIRFEKKNEINSLQNNRSFISNDKEINHCINETSNTINKINAIDITFLENNCTNKNKSNLKGDEGEIVVINCNRVNKFNKNSSIITRKINNGILQIYKKRFIKKNTETSLSTTIINDSLNKINWNEKIMPNMVTTFQYSPFVKKEIVNPSHSNSLIAEHSQLEISALNKKNFSTSTEKNQNFIRKYMSLKKRINKQSKKDKENILQINNYVQFDHFPSYSLNYKKKRNKNNETRKSFSSFRVDNNKQNYFSKNSNESFDYSKKDFEGKDNRQNNKMVEKELIKKSLCKKLNFSNCNSKSKNNKSLFNSATMKDIFTPSFLIYSHFLQMKKEKIKFPKDEYYFKKNVLTNQKKLRSFRAENVKNSDLYYSKQGSVSSVVLPANELYYEHL